MSSIIIKGMQMPSECRECPLCQYYMTVGETRCRGTGEVLASGFGTIKFDGRSGCCPLGELPEKHGVLIDRDALWNELGILYEQRDGRVNWNHALVEIKTAPTIVEAEGEE